MPGTIVQDGDETQPDDAVADASAAAGPAPEPASRTAPDTHPSPSTEPDPQRPEGAAPPQNTRVDGSPLDLAHSQTDDRDTVLGSIPPDTSPDVPSVSPTSVQISKPDLSKTLDDGLKSSRPRPRQTLPEITPDVSTAPTSGSSPESAEARDTAEDVPPIVEGEDLPGSVRSTEPDEPAPPVKRKRRSWMYALIGGLLFMSVAGPLVFYFFVWRYVPTARNHIPAGTNVAISFNGQELYLYEPFRKHVLGAFDGSPKAKARGDRLKKHTGIDVRNDVREVVFATMTAQSWIVLIGGKFGGRGRGKFVQGFKTFLEEEGVSGYSVDGDVLKGPELRIAMAEDATIMIANNDEILRAATEPSDSWQDLGLASSGAVSFVIDRGAFEGAGKAAPDKIPGLARLLAPDIFTHVDSVCRHTQRMTGFMKLEKEPKINIDIVPTSDSNPTALADEWTALQGDAKALESQLPTQQVIGLTEAILAAKFKPRNKSVMMTVPWSKKDIDANLEEAGKKIKALFGE